jgi:serine/threonine-protein kinase
MGSVHLGRLLGPAGFARTVAIKKPHKHLAEDPQLFAMFLDEARLVARIRHVNVVATLEVVAEGDEFYIVMEYVPGVSLTALVRGLQARGQRMPVAAAAAIVCGMLRGLHAAHEARSETGDPLGIVHRDVSPANVMVGTDGIARVLDFGVAKATNRLGATPGMELKGKLAYMAPEYLTTRAVTFASDLFSAGIVLWEALTLKRLFAAGDSLQTLHRVMNLDVPVPSQIVRESEHSPDELRRVERLDAVVMRALRREPAERYATALEMVSAIEQAVVPASVDDVAKLLENVVPDLLAKRAELVARVEASNPSSDPVKESVEPSPPSEDPSTTHAMTSSWVGSVPAKRFVPWRRILVAASLLGTGAAAFVIARAPRERESVVHAAVPAAAPAPPDPSPSAEREPERAPAGVALSVPPTPPSSPTPSSTPKPPPRRAQPGSGSAGAPTRARPPEADCEPPFVWEDGVKKFRPECFRGTVRQ